MKQTLLCNYSDLAKTTNTGKNKIFLMTQRANKVDVFRKLKNIK